jgi:hypothetical protein
VLRSPQATENSHTKHEKSRKQELLNRPSKNDNTETSSHRAMVQVIDGILFLFCAFLCFLWPFLSENGRLRLKPIAACPEQTGCAGEH